MLVLTNLDRDPGWLPLICTSESIMARDVVYYLPMLRTPKGASRPGEVIENIVSMDQAVSISGAALLHIHNLRRSPQSARQGFDAVGHQIITEMNDFIHEPTTNVDYCSILARLDDLLL